MRRDDRDDDAEETLVTVRVDPQPAGEPRTPPRQVGVGTQMRLLQSAGKSLTPGKYPALVSASMDKTVATWTLLDEPSPSSSSFARQAQFGADDAPWWCLDASDDDYLYAGTHARAVVASSARARESTTHRSRRVIARA